MDHGGGQAVHHTDPDLIRLDARAVWHTLGTHPVDRPHLTSGEAHHVQVEHRLQGAEDLLFGEGLGKKSLSVLRIDRRYLDPI